MDWHFDTALPMIENEYSQAHFHPASGSDPQVIREKMAAFAAENPELPEIILRAQWMAMLFRDCQIEINPYTPFCEKINHGVVYEKDNASGGVMERLASARYIKALDEGSHAAWQMRRKLWECGASCPDLDVWHICPDWEYVLRCGFAGMRENARQARRAWEEKNALTPKRKNFYDALEIVYTAVMRLLCRFREEAIKQGAAAFAETVDALTRRAPETLYEAMVLSHIYLTVQETGKERVRTYGCIDKMWYPYYEKDLAAKRLTEEEAFDLFRFFFIKTAAEQRFADQPICLGTGPLAFTRMILRAYDGLNIHNPKIHVRCSQNMDRGLLRQLLDMIRRGHSSIVLINDETVYRAYEKIGIPRGMSANYLPAGCYEPVIPGIEDARICSSWMNLSKPAEWALYGGEDTLQKSPGLGLKTPLEMQTYADYKQTFLKQLKHFVTLNCDVLDGLYQSQEACYAAPLLSGTLPNCVRQGKDMFENGMEIRNLSLKCFAIGTAVDSVMAVKEIVYDRNLLTLEELRQTLKNNWTDQKRVRSMILNSRCKWGNHVPEADALAKEIYDTVWDTVRDRTTANGGRYRIGCDSVAQADYGHRIGATADGRLAGTLLSKNMRPTNGMEREGVTAFIQSVASLDASRFADAAPLDIWLHPSAVMGEDGMNAFCGLVDTFFGLGGFCMHGNVLNAETLIDAQEHPERHQNLQIRVCGWNEYFVNLSRELQDDFILRSRGIQSV